MFRILRGLGLRLHSCLGTLCNRPSAPVKCNWLSKAKVRRRLRESPCKSLIINTKSVQFRSNPQFRRGTEVGEKKQLANGGWSNAPVGTLLAVTRGKCCEIQQLAWERGTTRHWLERSLIGPRHPSLLKLSTTPSGFVELGLWQQGARSASPLLVPLPLSFRAALPVPFVSSRLRRR